MSKDNFLSDDDRLRRCVTESPFYQFAEFYSGVVAVARDASIFWMNDRYPEKLGIANAAAAIKKHIKEVIPNSRMHEVVERGRPIGFDIMAFRDKSFAVTRLPLCDDGQVIGAMGIVLSDDASRDFSRLQRLRADPAQGQRKLVEAHRTKYNFDSIVGDTQVCKEMKQEALCVAGTESTVLILGETGTGKEMLAQAIHDASPRRLGPFVPVNVTAIPIDLFEAEVFGAIKNAGTNTAARDGLFKLADGGTLFLDEIGDMPLALQAKLLRALQEHEIKPVGSDQPTKVDVRVIAATNRNLMQKIDAGCFREDLFYRLNVFPIVSPPLRERLDDLPLLCEALVEKLSRKKPSVPSAVIECFRRHAWRGNVRELSNVLEYALVKSKGKGISLADIERKLLTLTAATTSRPMTLGEERDAVEPEAIRTALQRCGGNITQTAKVLGIRRSTLYEKLKKHGL